MALSVLMGAERIRAEYQQEKLTRGVNNRATLQETPG